MRKKTSPSLLSLASYYSPFPLGGGVFFFFLSNKMLMGSQIEPAGNAT